MLNAARIGGFALFSDAEFKGRAGPVLTAEGAQVGGRLSFDRATVEGTLLLRSLVVGANLNLGGANFKGINDPALNLERAKIGGDVFLTPVDGKATTIRGSINLRSASIDGSLQFREALILEPNFPADAPVSLSADGMRVGAQLSFDRVTVEGTLQLRNIIVGTNLNLSGAKLTSSNLPALNLEQAKIGGDVFLLPVEGKTNAIQGSINLRSASIDGALQFREATIEGPNFPTDAPVAVAADGMRVGSRLIFDRVAIEGALLLRNISVGTNLNLSGARLTSLNLPALNLEQAKIGGSVYMNPSAGMRNAIRGSIVLSSASIDGAFQFREASIDGANFPPDAPAAFSADGVRIGGQLAFERSTIDGSVVLRSSVIGANLNLNAAKLTSRNGPAINLQRTKIGGDVFMLPIAGVRNQVTGSIVLWNASIVGAMQIREASIEGANFPVASPAAIAADGMQIGDFLSFLRSDVRGPVLLTDVLIRRSANFSGTTIDNTGALALNLERSKIGGDLFIRPERTGGATPETRAAKVKGGVIMTATAVAGSVHISDALQNGDQALSFNRLNVAGALVLEKFECGPGRLSLANAKVSFLNDGDTTWPDEPGSLTLNGFDYGLLSGNAPTNWYKRLSWLRGSEPKRPTWLQRLKWLQCAELRKAPTRTEDEFNPQPFMTLVGVLRRAGHERDAKMIAISRHREARKYLGLGTFSWFGNVLMEVTCGYGYRPWLAALWIAAFVGFGAWIFDLKEAQLVKLKDTAALNAAGSYPAFNPIFYSADVLLPVVNLQQKDYWTPKSGIFARLYLPIHVVVGWFFTTLFVVGVTGLIRRE